MIRNYPKHIHQRIGFGKIIIAYTGGTQMIVLGVVLHYLIAMLFTVFFYLVFKPLALYRVPKLILGVLYGAVVWCIMNLLVVPNSLAKQGPFTFKGVSQSMGILMIAIGIPLAYLVSHQYSKHEIR